jgi:hypothetical protein
MRTRFELEQELADDIDGAFGWNRQSLLGRAYAKQSRELLLDIRDLLAKDTITNDELRHL